MALVKIDVDMETLRDTAREFQRWIDSVESGDMTIQELLSEMRTIVGGINEVTDGVARSLTL